MSDSGPYNPPPFARLYQVGTAVMTDGKNSWMGWTFAPGPMTLLQKFGTALYDKAVSFEESIDKGQVKVQDDGVGTNVDARNLGKEAPRQAARDQGVGPDRGDEPPLEAYAEQMGGDPSKINF